MFFRRLALINFFLIITLFNCSKNDSNKKSEKLSTYIHTRSGDSVGLDPAQETDGESYLVSSNIFNNLVKFKLDSTEVEPDLAKSWSISKDNLTYDFYLQENVAFHDGTKFNADSVLFSFNRQRIKTHPAYKIGKWSYWGFMGMSKTIKNIEKISDFHIRITLNKPEAPFLANLAMDFASIVSETAFKKYGKTFPQNPVGTGPFVFKKWARGQVIVLERNENYFDKKPSIDKLIFKSVTDPTSRFMSILSGESDSMESPDPNDLQKLAKNPKIKILKAPGMNVGYLAFNMSKKPLNDLNFRKALYHATDKKSIIDHVYEGTAIAAKNPIPPMIWSYNDKITDYQFNIDIAKKFLAKVKIPKDFEVKLYALPISRPYIPNGRKLAEVLQAQWKKIGIKTKIITYEWGTYLSKAKKGNEYDIVMFGWSGDNGDPDNFLQVLLHSKSSENYARFNNLEFDQLIEKAKASSKLRTRTDYYLKAQEIFHQQIPWIPIAHSTIMVPLKAEIKNLKIGPTARLYFNDIKK